MSDLASTFERCLRAHLQLIPEDVFDPSSDLRDLGLDSMSVIDLLLELESAFAITIPDELLVLATFRTGATLHAAIESLIEKPSNAANER